MDTVEAKKVKDVLKYGAWIVVAVVALVFGLRIVNLFEGDHSGEHTVFTPADSNFAQVVKKDYRPASTPFERPSKPVVKLPKGVSERDVKRLITVTKETPADSAGTVHIDTTQIIETFDGQVYVPKEEGKTTTVQETHYTPPIFAFDLFGSAGITVTRRENKVVVSPLLAIAPLQVLGHVQLPLIGADFEGVAAGAGYRYDKFMLGLVAHWSGKDLSRSVKLTVHYCFD
jgi:hypothetical protein